MKVLVVDEEIPHPLDTGKKIRTWNLLKRMRGRHEITFLSWGRVPPPPEYEGVRFVNIGRALPVMEGMPFYASLMKNLFSPLPFSVQRHASREMKAAFRTMLAEDAFDLIHCEWTPYVAVGRSASRSLPVVLSAHNVEARIWKRYVQNEKNIAKREFIRLQYKKFERFERNAALDCAHVITVSDEDRRVFQSNGCKNVSVVPNGVDDAYFHPWSVEERPFSLVFTGSMDWRPNQDGMRYFLREVFPLIQSRVQDVELTIVGRSPPAWLKEMAENTPGVTVTGSVDDVRPYIGEASLYVVPLRIGGGSRLKILEALAMQKVVLSTSIGAEGLTMEDGTHLLLRDAPEAFAETAIKAMKRPEEYMHLADQGRKHVLQYYTWDRISEKLDEVWCNLV